MDVGRLTWIDVSSNVGGCRSLALGLGMLFGSIVETDVDSLIDARSMFCNRLGSRVES